MTRKRYETAKEERDRIAGDEREDRLRRFCRAVRYANQLRRESFAKHNPTTVFVGSGYTYGDTLRFVPAKHHRFR
jgi:hypothetical protein